MNLNLMVSQELWGKKDPQKISQSGPSTFNTLKKIIINYKLIRILKKGNK